MRQAAYYGNTLSPTTNFPFGAYKNESSPGAHDGTNIVAEQLQDLLYSLYQVLQLAGTTPNNNLEDGNANKQFISALTNIGIFQYSSATSYNQGVITYTIVSGVTNFYRSNISNNTAPLSNTTNWTNLLSISGGNLLTMSGSLNFTDANQYIENVTNQFHIVSKVKSMAITGKNYAELIANAYYDGSNWHLIDNSKTAAIIQASDVTGSEAQLQIAPAGSDPITSWTNYNIWHTGNNPSSMTASGYQKLANGLIIQWVSGSSMNTETSQTINFPITFPNACLKVFTSTNYPSNNGSANMWFQTVSKTTSSAVVFAQSVGAPGSDWVITPDIFAIGN